MSRVSKEREGQPMQVRHHTVEFSFWPMARDTRRFGLQSRIFASDPINIIEQAVNRDCPVAAKPLALAYVEQARDFFAASQLGAVRAARPLLIYYAFMNLAKAFVLTKRTVATLDDTYHGIQAKFPATGTGPAGAGLIAQRTTKRRTNLFDLLLTALLGTGLDRDTFYELDRILPQIVLGHRLWCEATASAERFIEIDEVSLLDHRSDRNCWVRFDLMRSDYIRLGYTQCKLISAGRLQSQWQIVKVKDPKRIRFEMITPEQYTDRPSDVANTLVSKIRHNLWRSVTIVKPFRNYYVYVADGSDPILPQLCSIYLVLFYLGSITRYRPNHFDQLIAGEFGAFMQEFIENQANQWLYLFASEFAEREIARAAVV
jgi:hypothetical protein